MSHATSISTQRVYGVVMVSQEWGCARSTFYRQRGRADDANIRPPASKRGPRTAWTDEALTDKIREDLSNTDFVGEGHRKVWARLRSRGVRTSKARVLRLMRMHGLLAPQRYQHHPGPRIHDGTIVTMQPDIMWGTDATATLTRLDGNATIFIVVDHCTAECLGIHAAKRGDRFEALEAIRQAVRTTQGAYGAGVAAGLKLRHDHGSQFVSDVYQKEIAFLGIESSPSFVRQPEGNGCSERFIRTLKEQLLWIQRFDTVEELRQALVAWMHTYNEKWLIGRNGYLTPKQARRAFLPTLAVA
jgi:putative transposase